MDVDTLHMNKYEAQARLDHYKKALRRKHDDEYERTAAALEALVADKRVLVLSETIQNADRDAKQRPRIAIARADQKQVCYSRSRYTNVERFEVVGAHRASRDRVVEVLVGPNTPAFPDVYHIDGYALVPMTPPDVKGARDLSKLFVLWEVTWSDTRIATTPDYDPYLLKRIADDLYTVEGEWELTDVERAVMSGRREG
jgi:hypothetical protein